MSWNGASGIDAGIPLVRPLLGCSRGEIEQFAQQLKMAHREDKTNAGLDFLRNRCRHELLPLLREKYQPALSRVILRTMGLLEGESLFVTESAMAWLQARPSEFEQLAVAVQRRILQLQLFHLGLQADFD